MMEEKDSSCDEIEEDDIVDQIEGDIIVEIENVEIENVETENVEITFHSDQDYIISLLDLWELNDLQERFIAMNIDVTCLKFMTNDDINLLIPVTSLALRIKFRQKLFEWRLINVSVLVTLYQFS